MLLAALHREAADGSGWQIFWLKQMHHHEIGKGFEALKVSESPDIICDFMWPHRESASKDRPTIKKEILEVGETLAPS